MADLGEDVLFAGVAALSRRIRSGALSPVELARACLGRIDAVAPRLSCFVTVTPDRALADARRAEAELATGRWRGPLHGVAVALADTIDTAAIRTTLGARPHADRVPERDATLAARLAEAGAVLVGKLSVVELGGGLGYGTPAAALNGACRTPWDAERWAGGPSPGAASAVAAGLAPLAIAAQSGRRAASAAAFCGITSFRPTYGILSRRGTTPVAYSVDALGPVCRSAEDCAAAASALAGADPQDASSIAPPPGLDRVRPAIARGLRVGVVAAPPPPEGLAPLAGAKDAFEAAREVLRDAGAILSEAALPALPWDETSRVLVEAEAANAFEDLVASGRTRELTDPRHRGRSPSDYAPAATSADYVRASRIRGHAQRALARLFERHDLLLAPGLAIAPPRADASVAALLDAPDPLGAALDLAGLPAISFPVGLAGGFPVSALLVGPALEDARVLSAVSAFQARTAHHLQRPPVLAAGPAVAAVTSR